MGNSILADKNTLISDIKFPETQSDTFFTKLFASITKEPYAEASIKGKAVTELAAKLADEVNELEDFSSSLKEFYSLDGKSAEDVLTAIRSNMYGLYKKLNYPENSLPPEKEIEKAVNELNSFCHENYKMPFHRATLLQKAKDIDKCEPALKLQQLMLKTGAASAAPKFNCPTVQYPRYVSLGSDWPWKMQLSFHQFLTQRKEDYGCNWNFQYNKKIKKWFGLSPAAYIIIAANMWGMNIAANDNSLFIKAWTLGPVGFLPFVLAIYLPTVRY